MSEKQVLVSFGRSDPLRLTEATHELLGEEPDYLWGDRFHRQMPVWGRPGELFPLRREFLGSYDIVYTGHGATLLEATAAGCEVMVLAHINILNWFNPEGDPDGRTTHAAANPVFIPAWTGPHLDHSGHEVRWWEPGAMAAMAVEIRERRRAQ